MPSRFWSSTTGSAFSCTRGFSWLSWFSNSTALYIDPSLLPPNLTLFSYTAYPPQPQFIIPYTSVPSHSLRLQSSIDYLFSTTLSSETISLSNTTPDGNVWIFPSLSTRTNPMETYYRARVENGTTSASAWSVIRKHGDIIPPVFTSATTFAVADVTPVLLTLSSNEPVTYAINSGADASLLEIVNGNQIRLLGNISTDYGKKKFYYVTIRATDYGNNHTDQNITISVIYVARSQPQIMNVYDKHVYTTVSTDGLTIGGAAQNGVPSLIRSVNQVVPGSDVYIEVSVVSFDAANTGCQFRFGMVDAVFDVTNQNNQPGGNGQPGVTLSTPYGWTVFVSPTAYGYSPSHDPIVGDTFMMRIRRPMTGNPTIWFGANGVWKTGTDFTNLATGYTSPIAASDVYIVGGCFQDNRIKFAFTAGSFKYSIPSGATGM